jgi:hypothetical protein
LENFPFLFSFPSSFLFSLFSSPPFYFFFLHAPHATHDRTRGAAGQAPPAAHHPGYRPQTSSIFFMGQSTWMCMTFLLLSPPSILSETNSNLRILRDFIFQLNSDFISNSNLNPSRLLPHPYISLGASPQRLSTPISLQNQTLATTLSSTTSPVPLTTATPVPKSSHQIKPRAGHEKPMA